MCLKYDHKKTLAIKNGELYGEDHPPIRAWKVYKVEEAADQKKQLRSPFQGNNKNSVILEGGVYSVENAGLYEHAAANAADYHGMGIDVVGFHCFLNKADADLMVFVLRGAYPHSKYAPCAVYVNPIDIVAYGQTDNLFNHTSWLPRTVVASSIRIHPHEFYDATHSYSGI